MHSEDLGTEDTTFVTYLFSVMSHPGDSLASYESYTCFQSTTGTIGHKELTLSPFHFGRRASPFMLMFVYSYFLLGLYDFRHLISFNTEPSKSRLSQPLGLILFFEKA